MLFTTKQKYTSERLVRLPRSCRLSPQTSLRQPATSQWYPWLKATAELSCCSGALWPAQASLGHKVITEIGTQLIHQLSKQSSYQSGTVTLVQPSNLLLAWSWNLVASYTTHAHVSLLLSQHSDLPCKFLSLFQFLLIWLVNTRDNWL